MQQSFSSEMHFAKITLFDKVPVGVPRLIIHPSPGPSRGVDRVPRSDPSHSPQSGIPLLGEAGWGLEMLEFLGFCILLRFF